MTDKNGNPLKEGSIVMFMNYTTDHWSVGTIIRIENNSATILAQEIEYNKLSNDILCWK